jgi:hypothetical protein
VEQFTSNQYTEESFTHLRLLLSKVLNQGRLSFAINEAKKYYGHEDIKIFDANQVCVSL